MLRFLEIALFPRCHCFRFHPREASRPHISFFLLSIQFATLGVVWPVWSLRRVQILFQNGGHRGSRLGSAAPGCPALGSSEQRVRLLEERNAAYCWSGEKWLNRYFWNRRTCCCSLVLLNVRTKQNAFIPVSEMRRFNAHVGITLLGI